MSRIISIIGLVAVCAYSFTVRADIVIVVSPSTIFTDKYTNSLSELTEPSNSSYIWANWNTRTITSLISILMIWALSNA
jgi:hypothetical protein